jgi:TPR repeat protein
MPFSGDESDKKIVAALDEILVGRNQHDHRRACSALIKSCQNDELPEPTRHVAKLFLLQFCERGILSSDSDASQFDQIGGIDQLIARSWIISLMKKLECLDAEYGWLDIADIKADPLYLYLLNNIDHFGDQLLDHAIMLFVKGNSLVVKMLDELLVQSTHNDFLSQDARSFLNISPCRNENITFQFFEHLYGLIGKRALPQTAYWIGKIFLHPVKPKFYPDLCFGQKRIEIPSQYIVVCEEVMYVPSEYLRLLDKWGVESLTRAASQGYVPAKMAINELARTSECPNILILLSSLFKRGQIAGLSNKELGRVLEEKAQRLKEKIAFEYRLYAIVLDEYEKGLEFKKRIEEPAKWLTHEMTIDELAGKSEDPGIPTLLNSLFSENQISGITNGNLTIKSEKKAKKIKGEISVENPLHALRQDQFKNLAINKNLTFERRIRQAEKWLKDDERETVFTSRNPVFQSILILDELSELEHSMSVTAKQILNKWLSVTTNRIWVVAQYGIDMARLIFRCSYRRQSEEELGILSKQLQEYKDKILEQMTVLLQMVQEYRNQGDEKAAESLVYKLIEAIIEIELFDEEYFKNNLNFVYNFFYRYLENSAPIGGSFQEELRTRRSLSFKEICHSSDLPDCLLTAANTEGRPNATWQIGKIFLNDAEVNSIKEPFSLNRETGRLFEKATYYFNKAKNEGCLRLTEDLPLLSFLACRYSISAEHKKELSNKRLTLNAEKKRLARKIDFYRQAGLAGHDKANFLYLSLAFSENNDFAAEFELGKLYLDGSKAPFPSQDVWKGQEMLMSAVKRRHAGARFLVAHHYSPHTPHLPKLSSNDQHGTSLKYLEQANKYGRLERKQAIENREQAFLHLRNENYSAALFYFLSLSQEDDAEVHLQLGNLHLNGFGMQQKLPDKAIYFYQKAEEKKHPLALFMMAHSYLEKANLSFLGRVNQNFDTALTYFKKIAAQTENKDNCFGEASYVIATTFKEKISKGEIPFYLKQAYLQGSTKATKDIFLLSEQYRMKVEKSIFENQADLDIADDLLMFAAEAKYQVALNKLDTLKKKAEADQKFET